MRPLIAAALLLLPLSTIPTLAAPPPGTDLNSPIHQWFNRQYSINGKWCCSVADGHVLSSDDWQMTQTGYQVYIGSSWYPVPAEAMRDPKGGPNPTGGAVVWYTVSEYGLHIYCFVPGFEG